MTGRGQGQQGTSGARRGAVTGRVAALLALLALMVFTACTPALNWREVRLAGHTLLLFPCKPERVERRLPLAGGEVAAAMLVCDAAGRTWSATTYEMPDDARREQALREARHLLAMNLGGRELSSAAVQPVSLTPSPEARRLRLSGQRPGGAPLRADALFAADERWVVQLVVLSPAAATGPPGRSDTDDKDIDAAVDEFFSALRRSGPGAS